MARPLIQTVFPWRCPSCAQLARPVRSFRTAATPSQVAPESPRYIEIPEPPQRTYPPKLNVKGSLPVPREIFPRHEGGVDKTSKEYLASATPLPRHRRGPPADEAQAARVAWKQKMAESRRRNLRAGLSELQRRRKRVVYRAAFRLEQRAAERKAIDEAEEPEHERLTKSTTTALMAQLMRQPLVPDPRRAERIAAMKANVAAKETRRAEDRRSALHTLYMHARTFITSEKQLDSHIDEVFGTPENPVTWDRRGTSVWWSGVPDTIQAKLERANKVRSGEKGVEEGGIVQDVTERRIGKIAEELTGGKMDIESR